MNFEQITLTKEERKSLRRLAKGPIAASGNERLVRHQLAYPIRTYIPGRLGDLTGEIEITDIGMDYLLYMQQQDEEARVQRRHSWLTTLLSTFGGALLSKPVWAAITAAWEWLASLF